MDLNELLSQLDMPPGESYYRSRIPCPDDERIARAVTSLAASGLDSGGKSRAVRSEAVRFCTVAHPRIHHVGDINQEDTGSWPRSVAGASD